MFHLNLLAILIDALQSTGVDMKSFLLAREYL